MKELYFPESPLFWEITKEEAAQVLHCLQAYTRIYKKGEFIYHSGEKTDTLGLVCRGSVMVIRDDIWGNQSIFDYVEPGEIFAEAYACIPEEVLMVDVVAASETEILFLNTRRVLGTCTSACEFHSRLVRNLLRLIAKKNLNLTRKISHTSSRTIRGRLLSYLSYQVVRQGNYTVEIPFNRQQLADYLGVDRSAMSKELGKMRSEGLLEFKKNRFVVKE